MLNIYLENVVYVLRDSNIGYPPKGMWTNSTQPYGSPVNSMTFNSYRNQ